MCILNVDKISLMNKRSEHLAKCRHANKFIAANYKPPQLYQYSISFSEAFYLMIATEGETRVILKF